jgi:DNA-directed RNA polymerase subunit RPC12/RpoP
MECPMCAATVADVLVNDDRACEDCGHRWTPDEAPVAV